jgi:hypothetical protein
MQGMKQRRRIPKLLPLTEALDPVISRGERAHVFQLHLINGNWNLRIGAEVRRIYLRMMI